MTKIRSLKETKRDLELEYSIIQKYPRHSIRFVFSRHPKFWIANSTKSQAVSSSPKTSVRQNPATLNQTTTAPSHHCFAAFKSHFPIGAKTKATCGEIVSPMVFGKNEKNGILFAIWALLWLRTDTTSLFWLLLGLGDSFIIDAINR